MFVRVASLAAVLLVSLVCAAPARAENCEEDPCAGISLVRDVAPASAAEVPTDGVLVLSVEVVGELAAPEIRERITLTVSQGDQPVAGALEGVDIEDLLIWRPAAPLQPGGEYQVTGTIDNPESGEFTCGAGQQALAFEFTAAAGPAAPLDQPRLVVKSSYFDDPILSLTTAVCCNDAMAADQLLCGVSQGITWTRGVCAATSSRGYLRVLATAKTTADPASSGQWVRVLLRDGEPVARSVGTSFQRDFEAPTCLAIVQRSLATGESKTTTETCIGDDRQGELGVRDVDPSEMLADVCTTDLYTCEVRSGRWDPLTCKTWYPDGQPPPEDPGADETGAPAGDGGCGCRGGSQGRSGAASGLLALALLRRRRPRQRAARRAIVAR